ncbi:MAG: hypothetical protein U5O15_09665 [Candidatus Krumholzibacteriota bacterium]|nr:hypothetical protein [Candidatus Krumholzibacteriota bacterium]
MNMHKNHRIKFTLAGPGSNPLMISAAGTFALQGFTVVKAGGLVVNANNNLDINDNTLPATTSISALLSA